MKSRLILNLALLAIIVILVTLVALEPGQQPAPPNALAAVNETALAKVTLTNKDSIVFEKKDGHWRLTAPFQAPANEIRVRQLIDIAKSHSEADYPVKPEDYVKFELDPPKATLVLGKATTLVFGGSDPIHMRRYVRIGDTLHLVNDDFFHHLTASATDYVDKKLLPENAKVKDISIPGLKATLGQDGRWTQEAAPNTQVDIPELATTWTTARAIDVKRLDKPAQGDLVRIGLAEGNPVEFIIVQREPDLVLARQDLGLQYELTSDTARQLLNLPKTETSKPPQPASDAQDPDVHDEAGPEEGEEGVGEEEPAVGEDDAGDTGGEGEPPEPPSDE